MAYLHFKNDELPRRALMEMLSKGELCDLIVVCQQTHRSFHVHGLVLVSMAPGLEDFCVEASATDGSTRMVLPYTEKTVEALITTAYEGADKVPVDISKRELMEELLSTASNHGISELTTHIASKMFLACTNSSMISLHMISKMFRHEPAMRELSRKLVVFMAKNVKEIISSKANLDPEAMQELLESPHLQLDREAAQAFLSSWSRSREERLTRQVMSPLKRAANKPTRSRLPARVTLAAGGWSNVPTNIIEVFNPLLSSWSPCPSLTLPGGSRAYHGLEVTGGTVIWCVGGYSQSGGFLNTLHAFNLATGRWAEMSRMSEKRCYVSTVTHQGNIYALGGHAGGTEERLSTVEVFDIATNQWTSLPSMLHARSDFASVVFRGEIYAIGGFAGTHYNDSVEKFNPGGNVWSHVTTLQVRRSGACAVLANDRIYVLGGYDGVDRLASVECFSPGLMGVTRHVVPDMLHRRSNFSAVLVDSNTIMVVGGFMKDLQEEDGEVSGHVELLDVTNNVWRTASPLTVPRSALKAITVDNFYG